MQLKILNILSLFFFFFPNEIFSCVLEEDLQSQISYCRKKTKYFPKSMSKIHLTINHFSFIQTNMFFKFLILYFEMFHTVFKFLNDI